MDPKLESVLTDVPLFAGLGTDDVATISSHAVSRVFPKNAIIVNEGDQSESLYVILSGRVKAYSNDKDGNEIILNFQGPGEYFGELALLDETPRSVSVMTLEPTRLAIISKEEFCSCLAKRPEIGFDLIREFVKRVRELTEKVKSLGLEDVYGRVTRTLVALAKQRDDKKLVIEHRLTHQDIANMVGSSREMVSRIMADLSRGGYIAVEEKRITINKKLPAEW
jgi:CRP/FNR family cyclic AMP-dependent transcriptional regulator